MVVRARLGWLSANGNRMRALRRASRRYALERGQEPVVGDEMTWHDLGLRGDVARAAEDMGLEKPTEVQAKGAKEVLSGKDALLASHTGSGKTLGYLLPMVSKLKDQEERLGVKGSQPRRPRALVLAPTRELSEQVLSVAKSLSHRAKVATAGASGGTKLKPQRDRLAHSVDILVGTPGRVLFHCERKDLNLSAVDIVVLDEADTLVTGGFQECQEVVRRIRDGERRNPAQVVMAAATVSKAVERELERACSDSGFETRGIQREAWEERHILQHRSQLSRGRARAARSRR